MSYPEFHHIGFKIISVYFMCVTISQNNEKLNLRNKKIGSNYRYFTKK